MRLIRVFRSSTSATTLKFVFCLILVEGALCVQTHVNASAKNTAEKNGPDGNRSSSNGPIKPEVRNGPERKDSDSRSPAPVQESAESEEHKEYLFENDSVHETISPVHETISPVHETISSVHEVDQYSTTEGNQEMHISESSRENLGFRPSMHLGQIGEINFTGTIINPFNKVQHIGFENVLSPEANIGSVGIHPQSVRQKAIKFYDTDNGYKPEAVKVQPNPPIQLSEYLHNLQNQQNLQSQHHQNQYAESDYAHRAPARDMRIIQGILSMRPMSFDGGNYNLGTTETPYHYVNVERPYPVTTEKPYHGEYVEKPYHVVNVENPYSQEHLQKPYSFVNTETPYHFVFEKPTKFHSEEKFAQPPYAQEYEYIKPFQYEHLKKPEFEYEHFKKPELYLEHFKKPEFHLEYFKKPAISVDYLQPGLHGNSENFGPQNVVYITTHETTLMRTKKYPSQYHSPLYATELPILHEDHSHEYDSHEKRYIWKEN